MKPILITLISFFILTEISVGQSIYIHGKIEGIKDSSELIIQILPLELGKHAILKRVKTTNGEFKFNCELQNDMWHLARIDCEDFNKGTVNSCSDKVHLDISFFIQPNDSIELNAKKAEYGAQFSASGNPISLQQNQYLDRVFDKTQGLVRLIEKRNASPADKSIQGEIEQIHKDLYDINLEYIKTNPNWEYSAMLLADFDQETMTSCFSNFSSSVKTSFFGKHIKKIIAEEDEKENNNP